MADLPTREEMFRRWRNAALAVPDTRISPREIDRDGSDLNLQAAAASIMGEEMVNRGSKALAGCFEDTATGDQLDRVIFDRKGIPRLPAEVSVGQVSLTRATAAAGAGTIDGGPPGSGPPAPSRIKTNRGIVYILTQPAVFGAADLGPIVVDVQAELAGLDQEVAEDQDWSWVDTPFDPSIEIANPVEMAGAADEETDSEYRARAKQFFPTIRRGTLGAIEFGLLSTPGIASVSVIEVENPESGFPACVVQAFVLDELGRSNETLAARGLQALLEFRAAGIPVIVIPGEPSFVNVDFVGTEFDTSVVLDSSEAENDVKTRIVAALNNQRPGENLLRSTIIAAAKDYVGFVVEDDDLVEPATTLIPSAPSVAFRTKRELITIN